METDTNLYSVVATTITAVAAIGAAWLANRGRNDSRDAKRIARETHHQVYANHHESDPPTLPDRLELVEAAVTELVQSVKRGQDQQAQRDGALWAAIDEVRSRLPRSRGTTGG